MKTARRYAKSIIVAAGAVLVARQILAIRMGEAWDDGYRTGREAEREDWNYPEGMK